MSEEQKEVVTTTTEKISVGEAITFWEKNKDKIFGAILLIIGAFGGNVDRFYAALPDVYGVVDVKKDVKTLKIDVEELKKKIQDDFKGYIP